MDDNIIRVSFKNNPSEQQLKQDILNESRLIGKSAWMKLAAKEKIQRDREKNNGNNTIKKQVNNNRLPIINDLCEIFKGG